MYREHDLHLRGHLFECPHELRELLSLINVRGPVQGHHRVGLVAELQTLAGVGRLDPLAQHLEGVDHDVADAVDFLSGYPLRAQVCVSVGGGRP